MAKPQPLYDPSFLRELLKAMEKRPRGEVWDIRKREGRGFLVPGVAINPTTLSYIDIMITQTGLLTDVSVEKVHPGLGARGNRVDGRSAIRLSDFGRFVIVCMITFKKEV